MEVNDKPHFLIILVLLQEPMLLIRQVGGQTPKVSLKHDRKREKSALMGPESRLSTQPVD
jgi:hypothetical protein